MTSLRLKKKFVMWKKGGGEACVDKGEVFNHSVIKMKAQGPHKWHCLNCLHFNSFHCLAWMCRDYTGGSPGFDLYSLSKWNFLSNPLTFTDVLLKPLISLRVRWPQCWCKWMPISDKIQEEYHQNCVKMNKSFSMLMWIIIILGIYVKNVKCD